jgi:ribonuclease VapC
MVVDTSALVAIVYTEPDHRELEQAIAADDTRLISAASVIEASIVVTRRAGADAAARALTILDGVIGSLGLTIEPVTAAHVDLARAAYVRYGKGMNAAGLNYGDCFSYALAKDSGEPPLFKGDDFAHTDITPCL